MCNMCFVGRSQKIQRLPLTCLFIGLHTVCPFVKPKMQWKNMPNICFKLNTYIKFFNPRELCADAQMLQDKCIQIM